jgi:hypothetical protein
VGPWIISLRCFLPREIKIAVTGVLFVMVAIIAVITVIVKMEALANKIDYHSSPTPFVLTR